MSRKIVGLTWASEAKNPWPRLRLNTIQSKGKAYERKVMKSLRGARHNPWFQFEDTNGYGMCSPDFILRLGNQLIILECKLTDCQEARDQLLHLYAPVVGRVYQCQPRCVVVAKVLRPESTNVVTSLESALALRELSTLHWLGRGSFPLLRSPSCSNGPAQRSSPPVLAQDARRAFAAAGQTI